MGRKKSLSTVLEQQRRLQAIRNEIVGEMVRDAGEMMVAVFRENPADPLWAKYPALSDKLEELATVITGKKIQRVQPGLAPKASKSVGSRGTIQEEEFNEKMAGRFVADIADDEL